MATLTNTKIKDTYDGLLKTTDNDVIGITEKVITDGLGNASILSIGTQSASFSNNVVITGSLTASGLSYPTSDGTAGQAIVTDAAGNLSFATVTSPTPTLQQVTTAGATTTDSITVGGLTAASLIYPSTDGTSGQVISTDGAGNLTFTTVSTSTPSLDQVTAVGATSSVNVTINGADLGTIVSSSNTLLGDGALASFTTGSFNTAIGYQALTAATGGSGNTVIGSRALDNYTSGTTNTAIGSEALGNGTTLSYNVAIGDDALFYINGSYNVALGHNAGETRLGGGTKSAGDNNIYIGSNTVSSAADTDNEIVIGANAVGNGSNSATYGDSNITNHFFTAGDVSLQGGRFIVRESDNGNDAVKITRDADEGYVQVFSNGSQTVEIRGNGNSYFNGGNVGIGEQNPQTKLHLTDTSTDFVALRIDNANTSDTGTETSEIRFLHYRSYVAGQNDAGSIIVGKEQAWNASGNRNSFMSFSTRDGSAGVSERMRIDSSGTVSFAASSSLSSAVASIGHLSSNGYLYIKGGTGGLILGDDATASRIQIEDNSNIRFETAGSEAMRIDSSGNVGIGEQNPQTGMHISLDTPIIRLENIDTSLLIDQELAGIEMYSNDASGLGVGIKTSIRAVSESNTGSKFGLKFSTTDSTGSSDVERMRIDSSGRVGIGTQSADDLMHIEDNDSTVSATQLTLEGRYGGYGAGINFVSRTSSGGTRVSMAKITADGESSWNTTASTQDAGLRFFTTDGGSQSERMRITSGGDVCIGTTSATGILNLENDAPVIYTNATNGVSGLRLNIGGGSTNLFRMQSAGTNVFLVYSNGNYDFTGSDVSDIAFKENITEITSGLSIIDALVPKTYNMIGREHIRKGGFIAQEVEQVLPEAVHGEDGQKGLDYNSILAHSVKAIQELKAEIEILKSQLNA